MAKLTAELTLRLQDLPELMADLRSEISGLIMEVAEQAEVEDGLAVAKRLREIAYAFESGLREGGDDAGAGA